jgi:tetratricopeptide (TPR) repeat protein
LGNLGLCYADLGQIHEAIKHYGQALVIAQDIGDRKGEANHLGNLGLCYAALGQIHEAIDHHGQALVIARDIGDRKGEAIHLGALGDAFADQSNWRQAIQIYQQAILIADQIGFVEVQSGCRLGLAAAYLAVNNILAAQNTAEAAREHDYPPRRPDVWLMLGMVGLRQSDHTASQAFMQAVTEAETRIQHTPEDYRTLDIKALALCGLALLEDSDRLTKAAETFETARTIANTCGIVHRVRRLFDAIAAEDKTDILTPIREAVMGKKNQD